MHLCPVCGNGCKCHNDARRELDPRHVADCTHCEDDEPDHISQPGNDDEDEV